MYRGLSVALMRHAGRHCTCIYVDNVHYDIMCTHIHTCTVYSSRLVHYEILREHVFKRDKNGQYPIWKSVLTGALAGTGGQLPASPGDLVKIRLQMEGRKILDGHNPKLV